MEPAINTNSWESVHTQQFLQSIVDYPLFVTIRLLFPVHVQMSNERRIVFVSTHEYAGNCPLIRVGSCRADFMGNKTSKKEKVSNHIAFSSNRSDIPNIVVTHPTPLDENKKFLSSPAPLNAPPNSPTGRTPEPYSYSNQAFYREETRIMAGTPPPEHPPPPPPPMEERIYSVRDLKKRLEGGPSSSNESIPTTPVPAPRNALPTIKRNIFYAKDKISKFEALNTTDRKQDPGYAPLSHATPATAGSTVSTKCTYDDYPIYNSIEDFTFQSGKTFAKGSFPIDANRINIGFCGRQGAGKSTLINALRGISNGEPQSAGRYACDNMEPFRFIEDDLQNIVLWEIPYPRTFTSIVDIYDRNMGFDRFYDSHKLHLFHRLFVLISDGSAHDDDVAFCRVIHSRRTALTLLSTKSDDDVDAESRETARPIGTGLLKFYDEKARRVFTQALVQKAQILASIQLLLISAPVVRNILSGSVGYLHYKLDEDRFLDLIDLKPGCHFALESKMRREREENETLSRPSRLDDVYQEMYSAVGARPQNGVSRGVLPNSVQKSTVLADAGFEILYGTDDRVFGQLEAKTTVVRAGKTAFNYGFIGCSSVGKSSMINAMRGMSSRHPLAAGRGKAKPGSCERYEFDDDLLKYSVTLWELHYPKKVNHFFEFIDRHNLANFTAIFVLIDGVPTDQDLTFAKIAHRRNATVVFLSSKSDKKLSTRSRADEIPVCDLLKQRFVDKGMARFERSLSASAPELCGRVHSFFVSAPVFRALRVGDPRGMQYLLHERAVFDFLKQKRIIAEMLDSPQEFKEGLYANVNVDTAGVIEEQDQAV